VKHAVIFAHPNLESFTASVAGAYVKTAEALGHAAVTRDLYRMNFASNLQSSELPWDKHFCAGDDVQAERAILRDIDVFAFIYPFWLNSPPAIIKGYLERVFGFGFAYGEGGRSYNALLAGRKMITFSSSGAPASWGQQNCVFEAVRTLFDRSFSEVCGMASIDHVHFGGVTPGIREDWVEGRLADVEAVVKRHFGASK
jgi:NAD(P)H dehydrogenase (quinone)